jgi:hypothetical protein
MMWEIGNGSRMEMQRDMSAERFAAAAKQAAVEHELKVAKAAQAGESAVKARSVRGAVWGRIAQPVGRFARLLGGLF